MAKQLEIGMLVKLQQYDTIVVGKVTEITQLGKPYYNEEGRHQHHESTLIAVDCIDETFDLRTWSISAVEELEIY